MKLGCPELDKFRKSEELKTQKEKSSVLAAFVARGRIELPTSGL